MKKIFLFIVLGLIFILSSNFVLAESCYQESADVSNLCGALSTGNYSVGDYWTNNPPSDVATNVYDGNWSIGSSVDSAGNDARVYIDYSKPANAQDDSLWQISGSGGMTNLTIPLSCWDYYPTKISLLAESSASSSPFADKWYCYNGTWVNLHTGGPSTWIYEEAMIWNIITPPITGNIQWENESILNVNSSVWWQEMNGFNVTHFANNFGILEISQNWLRSFVISLINYNYVANLGFYPASNPSNFYNVSTLPPQSGVSFKYYNLTNVDITTNQTNYNTVVFAIPLSAGKKISIECNLLVDSSVTTTGIQFNSSVSGTSSRDQIIEYYSSATAQAICSGDYENLTCSATSSAGTKMTPTRINVYTVQVNDGLYLLKLKSEIAGSAVNVRAGSWCRSIES